MILARKYSEHASEGTRRDLSGGARELTRVKDLPDMALLGTTGAFDGALLRRAFDATFSFRNSHPLRLSGAASSLGFALRAHGGKCRCYSTELAAAT